MIIREYRVTCQHAEFCDINGKVQGKITVFHSHFPLSNSCLLYHQNGDDATTVSVVQLRERRRADNCRSPLHIVAVVHQFFVVIESLLVYILNKNLLCQNFVTTWNYVR